MAELPKPEEPISSDSKIGSEAADIIEEQLPPPPVDSMIEAFKRKKRESVKIKASFNVQLHDIFLQQE